MDRNITKQVKEGKAKLDSCRCLSIGEVTQLINIASDVSVLDAITAAFYAGAATGIRQAEQQRG